MTTQKNEGSFREKIKRQAKTALKIDLDFPPNNQPNEVYWLYANRLWVSVDVVLGLYAEDQKTRKQKLQQIESSFNSVVGRFVPQQISPLWFKSMKKKFEELKE